MNAIQKASHTVKVSCIIGRTWTWAAFQSVVIHCLTCSDSRQHMVLYLSLERHTLDPRTSARAVKTADEWVIHQLDLDLLYKSCLTAQFSSIGRHRFFCFMRRLSQHRVKTGWIHAVQLLHYTQLAPTCASAEDYLSPHEDSTQSVSLQNRLMQFSKPLPLQSVTTTGGKDSAVTERTRSRI